MSTGPSESTTPKSPPTRYANKDGSKFITVPRKPTSPEPAARPSSPRYYFSSPRRPGIDDIPPPIMDFSRGANNASKKKKKKKSKGQSQQQDAAQDAPQYLDPQGSFTSPLQLNNNSTPTKTSGARSHVEYQQHIKASLAQFEPSDPDPDDMYDSEEGAQYEQHYTSHNGQQETAPPAGKKKNKKKKKKAANPEGYPGGGDSVSGSIGSTRPAGNNNPPSRKGKDRIWNTSTNEERERIKEFWLSLGEDDRRSLVKVEKEAVLKKMKEQQKHSCSCSVCGRKRTAIEEELEVLYDAYYEELEQYANQQQSKFASPLPPHFATRGPPPSPLGPTQTGIEELDDDDDGFEDDYEDDEGEDDEIVEDEPLPETDSRSDIFAFGNSLTVKGGILTVADDLLKNDGKKFIEMMEQLAERRMQREEEANAAPNGHLNMTMTMSAHGVHSNNHPTQTQEYDDEDEDEEDYRYDDEEDDEDDEDDDEPDMSEEQRMEEGRKMFQIFAARMFEQRVLQAYREKVAQERQRKLLEELEEETRLKEEREQRRVKEKERKKDRKRQQKLAKEEERLKREAEKAAEEAALKAIEDKKAEEARKRKEEIRQKKEAERRAAEEERQRKEEEKKKRQQEEREREIEKERKRKEHQERERKKKEDAARKAKEEKEVREKEAREKREREERDRRIQEAKAKKVAEEEKARREEEGKRAAAAAITAAALATARAQQAASSNQYNSPHGTIATPAVPKQPPNAPNQVRPRQPSQQESVGSSPKTPQVLPRLGLAASPSTPTMQQSMPGPQKAMFSQAQFVVNHLNSPILHTPHTMGPPPGVPSPHSDSTSFSVLSTMSMNGPGPFLGNMSQRGNGMPMYMPQGHIPISNPQYRGFSNTNGLPMPLSPAPGLRPVGQNSRGVFTSDFGGLPQPLGSPIPVAGLPMFPPNSPFPMGRTDTLPSMHSHGRQPSGTFDDRTIQRPVQQPTPIQRPQSTKSDEIMNSKALVDDLSSVLGSRALIDDEGLEVHYSENVSPSARRGSSLFGSRPGMGFGGIFDPIGPQGKDIFSSSPVDWGHIPIHQPLNSWTNGAGWSDKDTPRRRRGETRLDQIRLLACKVCRELSGPSESKFLERGAILKAMTIAAPREIQLPISQRELDDLVEVEGDIQNGGGVFVLDRDSQGHTLIKFEPGDTATMGGKPNPAPGEIGSPSIIGSFPVGGSGFTGGAMIPPMMGPPPGIGTMPVGSVGSVGSGGSASGSGVGGGGGGAGGGNSGGFPKFGTAGNNANQFMA